MTFFKIKMLSFSVERFRVWDDKNFRPLKIKTKAADYSSCQIEIQNLAVGQLNQFIASNIFLPKILLNSILKVHVWPLAKQIWKNLVRGKHCFLGVVSTPSKSCFFQIWAMKWPEPKMFIYDKISLFHASASPKKNFWIISKDGHFTAILSSCTKMG